MIRHGSVIQLLDGRICFGCYGGIIYVYSLITGECELSWKAGGVDNIICIDATRICEWNHLIKVWNTDTGKRIKTLNKGTEVMDPACTIKLMPDYSMFLVIAL